MRPSIVSAALLDVDGTLVDSNRQHAEAWVECLQAHGYSATYEQVRPLIGMGGDKVLPLLAEVSAESTEGKTLSEARTKLFMERYLPTIEPLPGARALLERLRARGVLLVVATSANEEELNGLLSRGQVADLLPKRTSSDDAEHSKPDEDIVVAALRKARVRPEEALMLGDTPYDLEAATRANVGFLGFTSGGYDAKALQGALAIYRDPADLLAKLDSSPFAVK